MLGTPLNHQESKGSLQMFCPNSSSKQESGPSSTLLLPLDPQDQCHTTQEAGRTHPGATGTRPSTHGPQVKPWDSGSGF